MTILLTGSNGLLGQKVVGILKEDPEVTLIATSRGKSGLPPFWHGFTYESLDITQSDRVKAVIEKYKPDCVINTAAMTRVDDCELNQEECWSQNVTSVQYLVQACELINAHIIQLSTDFVFDGTEGPLDETAAPNPVNFYGKSKLAAEDIVRRSKTPWSIVRTVLVYGISNDISRSNIILWVKNNLEQGKPIKVVDDQWRTPTLAEDLASGSIRIAEKKAFGIFHISGSDYLTPYDIAKKTAKFFSLDESLIERANASNFRQPAERPLKTGFKIQKAISELGFKPRSLDEGIALLAKQLRD
ncbi:MAG: NAD(P)-dependent oxidoreductase [Bacteroidota bacterium]